MKNGEAISKAAVRGKKPFAVRLRDFKDNCPYLVMLFPAVLVVFLFNYMPIYGVLIAFQDFVPGDNILSSTTQWWGWITS